MKGFIPHKHVCEVKLCYPTAWKEYCPRMGNLTDEENECETCPHFVTIEFMPENPLHINKIIHVNMELAG